MKKIIVLTLTFMLAVQMVVPVVANEYIESEYGVAPFYNNTLEVQSSIAFNGSTVSCKATNKMSKNLKSKITMTLQKSKDKNSYSKVQMWSKDYSGTGTKSLTETKTVSKGYYYRVRVVVRIYSGTEVIEKITKYSKRVNRYLFLYSQTINQITDVISVANAIDIILFCKKKNKAFNKQAIIIIINICFI